MAFTRTVTQEIEKQPMHRFAVWAVGATWLLSCLLTGYKVSLSRDVLFVPSPVQESAPEEQPNTSHQCSLENSSVYIVCTRRSFAHTVVRVSWFQGAESILWGPLYDSALYNRCIRPAAEWLRPLRC
jgi:hypothetical protein